MHKPLIEVYSFQFSTKADDIYEFEIEGISIGDSLLNYFTREEVDTNTIFSMASTTKAFIGMGLGILIDRDSISWNDKVVDHLPDFKLSNLDRFN